MKRLSLVLAVLWGLELVGGTLLLAQRRFAAPRPPTPDWSLIDPLAAEEIAAVRERCAKPDDWRRLGECLTAYGYFREAEACHRVAALQLPDSSEDAFRWAFSLERLGLLDEANRSYERAAQLDSRRAGDCRYFMGRNRLRQEQPEAAMELFQQAGRLPAARYEQARLLARDGRLDEALEIVQSLGKEYPPAYQPRYLGYRIARLRGDDAALAAAADAAALGKWRLPNPFAFPFTQLTKTYHELGSRRVALQARQASGSLAALEARLQDVRNRFWIPEAADMLAELAFERGDLVGAKRLLEEALEREGPSAHFLIRLGDIHEDLGDLPQAERFWQRAIPLGAATELKDLQGKLGGFYAKKGDKVRAAQHLAEAYFGAGVESFWADNLDKAQGALRLAVEQNPEHDAAWFYLGETCRLLRQPAEARAAYEKSLKLRPENSRAARGLALVE
jgi:tetratricopeptide (TPR) repeat protein